MTTLPSLFPVYRIASNNLYDGSVVSVCNFCKKSVQNKTECIEHYKKILLKPPGYHQCPFGFTSRNFYYDGEMWVITGVIAFPRFDTPNEREMAKRFPETKVSRDDIEHVIRFFSNLDTLRADVVAKAAKVFPQAFHELRKLNAAILQHAEKEINELGEVPALVTIRSAAELMKNNFDILEALSNPEGMRAIPADSTVSVLDLVYKTLRVLRERAKGNGMRIELAGSKVIIRGSQKSFPIVPAVLIENAIKYGTANTPIEVDVSAFGKRAILTVKNQSIHPIDPERCFDRGSRYAGEVAEGGGFGLFLAKEIVLAHNGTIRCIAKDRTIQMVVELPLEKIAQ
ncbi:MAG TPA: HAMP domain-containing sensor histidine kinase [Verrucomicrobiae bacterium]|jgi:signal transduction histidine kinase